MQALSRRHRVWLAVLQVLLLLAAIAMPATASTSPDLLTGQRWLSLLQSYDIVRGDQFGNLNLDKPIRRAEMVVIMVRALNAEQDAKLFVGLSPFEDTKGHWAEAEIAYASVNKLIKGDGNSFFRPDDHITYAESLTLLLRLLGKEPTAGNWPINVLLVAGELDLVPPGVTAGTANAEAIRGLIFQSMAKAVAEVKDAEGKTFLQRYLDTDAPELSVSVPETSDTDTLEIAGTVKDAAFVTVNGEEVTLVNGAFSTEISLEYGDNAVAVVAQDYANNQATYTATVSRPFPVATLTIEGPDKVAPGNQATYNITALDHDGEAVSPNLLTVKVEGNIGTFNKASGVLSVTETPGASGKIVVSAGKLSKSISVTVMGQAASASALQIDPVSTVAYTKPMTVTVKVTDAEGAVVTNDFGRPVVLSVAGLTGTTVTPSTAYTEAGVATFTVKATQMGDISLSASSTGLASSSETGIFGSTTRVRLIADPTELIAGGVNTSARIKAELVDENGNVVRNDSGEVIEVRLSTDSEFGMISDDNLTIARSLTNSTASGNDGLFAAFGQDGGTATITGTVTYGPDMTVEPVSVKVIVPTLGSGSKMQAKASQVMLNAPGTANFVVRMVDANGNFVPTGNYAFQLKVETSNNEEKTNGLPDGVSVELGSTGLNPVSDGTSENHDDDTDDIIARTINGIATIKVHYDKPGVVTITPIPMGGTSRAYDDRGDDGSASSATGFSAEADSIIFTAQVGGISLTVDSNIGDGQPFGAMPDSSSSSVKVNVTVTDGVGNWIPNMSRRVTLEWVDDGDDNTTPPTNLTQNTSNGKATFVVKGKANAGTDTYRVTLVEGSETHTDTVTITTQTEKPSTPVISMVRGYTKSGSTIFPGTPNEVGIDDDGLAIFLEPVDGDSLVMARVFVEGSSSPIYTSDALDVNSSDGVILVPKDKLPAASKRYAVSLRNGLGETKRSDYSASVLNVTYTTNIAISSAKYDAKTKKLFVTGSGFSASTSSPDTVYTSQLWLEDKSTGERIDLTGAEVDITSSSAFNLLLTPGMYSLLEDPSAFGGSDIKLHAEDSWYEKYNGQKGKEDLNNTVSPGARVHYAVFDKTNKRLHVFGEGLSSGSMVWGAFDLINDADPETDAFDLSKMSPTRRGDSELIFSLSSTAVTKLSSTLTYVVRVSEGFLKDGSALAPEGGDLEIHARVSLTKMTYTVTKTGEVITGAVITISGTSLNFDGGDVDPTKFYVIDLRNPDNKLYLAAETDVTVGNDAKSMTLELTAENAAALEDNSDFRGLKVFLRADEGWVQHEDREAAPVTGDTLQFPSM